MVAPNPTDYAIVIGVDHYGPGIPPLGGCVNDAELFYEWLIDPDGGGLDPTTPAAGGPSRVQRIVSPPMTPPPPPSWPPSRNDVENALLDLADWAVTRPNGRVGRRLYLWFSGHGMAVQNLNQECAALMSDAKNGAFTRSIPGRRAADNFTGAAMFDEVVLFMDCCRTAVAGVTESVVAFPYQASPEVGKNVRQLYGFAARWAATATEKLLPHPTKPKANSRVQGVFAHAVLEGLTKAFAADGSITSESLAGYVKRRVPELLPRDNNLDPDMVPTGPPIVFRPPVLVDGLVDLTDPARGFRVLRGSEGMPVVLAVPAAAATVQVTLPPGTYVFVSPDAPPPYTRTNIQAVVPGEVFRVQL